MLTAQKWIVCEKSGRWTAALRLAFSRQAEAQSPPRLCEVRTLAELSNHLDEHEGDLALIEIGSENLTEVLQLLMRRRSRPAQFVALFDGADDRPRTGTRDVVDLLWEAGATEVVESPRQLNGLLALQHRLSAACEAVNSSGNESQSFTDWAWSTLPWQDA